MIAQSDGKCACGCGREIIADRSTIEGLDGQWFLQGHARHTASVDVCPVCHQQRSVSGACDCD